MKKFGVHLGAGLFCFVLCIAKPMSAQLSPPPTVTNQVTILAFIDGPSDLYITKQGMYWFNGINAKPGRLGGSNEPTYVNGTVWFPKWGEQQRDRGIDKSDVYPIKLESLKLDFSLLSVSTNTVATEIEPRSPIAVSHDENEFVVSIPDPERGGRWYKFTLSKAKNESQPSSPPIPTIHN